MINSRKSSSKERGSDGDLQEVIGQQEVIYIRSKAMRLSLQIEMEENFSILLGLKLVREPREDKLFQVSFISN